MAADNEEDSVRKHIPSKNAFIAYMLGQRTLTEEQKRIREEKDPLWMVAEIQACVDIIELFVLPDSKDIYPAHDTDPAFWIKRGLQSIEETAYTKEFAFLGYNAMGSMLLELDELWATNHFAEFAKQCPPQVEMSVKSIDRRIQFQTLEEEVLGYYIPGRTFCDFALGSRELMQTLTTTFQERYPGVDERVSDTIDDGLIKVLKGRLSPEGFIQIVESVKDSLEQAQLVSADQEKSVRRLCRNLTSLSEQVDGEFRSRLASQVAKVRRIEFPSLPEMPPSGRIGRG